MSFDENGLTTKREPEYIQDIQDFQEQNVVPKFDYSDDKVIYQVNSVYAKSSAEVAELLETVYDSMDLSKAEGVWLDSLALLRGVTRIPALASFTNSQRVKLAPAAVIPAGSLWASDIVTTQATNPNEVVSNTDVSFETQMLLSSTIDSEPDGTVYSIVVNATTYTYTQQVADGLAEVVAGLTAEFDLDTGKTWTYSTSTEAGGTAITIVADVDTTLSTSSLTTLITTTYTTVYTTIQLVETGPIEVPAGAFDTLITSVVGFIETTNDDAFVLGRDKETDEELRVRVAQGPVSDCTGTILSIENSLLANVAGVTAASVIENVTDFPNTGIPISGGFFPDGIPYGGYETLVVGGTEEDVAADVWRTKPAGTVIAGNTQIFHVDSSGVTRTVYFSRPEQIHLAFEVEYTKYDEEIFPVNGETAMRDVVVSETTSLALDEDVIPSRYFGPIYNTVSGIDSLIVRVQQIASPGTAPNPGSWQTTKFAIGASQYASTEDQDVVIIDSTPP